MANANVSKIGLNSAVAKEQEAIAAAPEAAAPEAAAPEAAAPEANSAPNITERRVIGRKEVPVGGSVIVVENL